MYGACDVRVENAPDPSGAWKSSLAQPASAGATSAIRRATGELSDEHCKRQDKVRWKGRVRDRRGQRNRSRPALAFAREGAHVAVADVVEGGNGETTRLIEEGGGRALAVRCDVTRAADVQAALKNSSDVFGRLDFAFNNGGVEPKKLVPTAEVEEEEWDRNLEIDLRGVFLCMKYEIPLMLRTAARRS
jgi:hypothetical protein